MDIRNPSPKDLRTFGLVLAAVTLGFGTLAARKGAAIAPVLFTVSAASAAVALLRPAALIHVFRPWMRAAGFLGAVNTYLVMGALYYLVFTPYAVVARLLGFDPLDRKLRTADTYWTPKERNPEPDAYERQF